MIINGNRWFVRMESRYEGCPFVDVGADFTTSIEVQYWKEIKRTPRGVWLKGPYCNSPFSYCPFPEKKWMKLGAFKQFAHEDMDGAFQSLKFRRQKYHRILEERFRSNEIILEQLDQRFQELTNRSNDPFCDTYDLGTCELVDRARHSAGVRRVDEEPFSFPSVQMYSTTNTSFPPNDPLQELEELLQ